MSKPLLLTLFTGLLVFALIDLNGVAEALFGFEIRWRRSDCEDRSSNCVGNENLCTDEVSALLECISQTIASVKLLFRSTERLWPTTAPELAENAEHGMAAACAILNFLDNYMNCVPSCE